METLSVLNSSGISAPASERIFPLILSYTEVTLLTDGSRYFIKRITKLQFS